MTAEFKLHEIANPDTANRKRESGERGRHPRYRSRGWADELGRTHLGLTEHWESKGLTDFR
jgi:hypothetical protein